MSDEEYRSAKQLFESVTKDLELGASQQNLLDYIARERPDYSQALAGLLMSARRAGLHDAINTPHK